MQATCRDEDEVQRESAENKCIDKCRERRCRGKCRDAKYREDAECRDASAETLSAETSLSVETKQARMKCRNEMQRRSGRRSETKEM